MSTLGMVMFRPPDLTSSPSDDHVSAVGSRNRALHQDHVVLDVHLDDFEVPHSDSIRSHAPAHPHPGENARGKAGRAYRTRSAVEHRTVRGIAAAEMMALDHTRETSALADADDVHFFVGLEFVGEHAVARLQIAVRSVPHPELAQEFHAFGGRLFQVSRVRLVDARFLDVFHQAQLHGVISVDGRRLALHHHAWTGLEHRYRHYLAIRRGTPASSRFSYLEFLGS